MRRQGPLVPGYRSSLLFSGACERQRNRWHPEPARRPHRRIGAVTAAMGPVPVPQFLLRLIAFSVTPPMGTTITTWSLSLPFCKWGRSSRLCMPLRAVMRNMCGNAFERITRTTYCSNTQLYVTPSLVPLNLTVLLVLRPWFWTQGFRGLRTAKGIQDDTWPHFVWDPILF